MMGMMSWMVLGPLLGIVLLIAFVAVTVWLLRRPNGDPGGAGTPEVESPEEVARRRYAAGEIDEDEYLRLRAGLRD